jgi:segregation and condensation protein B
MEDEETPTLIEPELGAEAQVEDEPPGAPLSEEGPSIVRSDALIEALIFASGEALDLDRLCAISTLDKEEVLKALSLIKERYQEDGFGFELAQVAGKYQFRTKPEFALYLRELKADRPRRLTNAALETLAIVAYRQPVVRSDIEKIRGVDVTPTLKTLLERGLIKIVGHQNTVGQPALFGTSEEFLKLFGLDSLAELPSLRDLREFEREPGEVKEEPPQETQAE